MKKNKIKVTIFTSPNSYFNQYIPLFKKEMADWDICFVSDKTQLVSGDVAFYLSCYELIGPKYLSLHKHNIVIHESDLPSGKGWSPASWTILSGNNTLTLSLFEMSSRVDAGDIYFKDTVVLDGTELKDEWQTKIILKKIEMCQKFLKDYLFTKPTPQSGPESFYPKRTPADCELDINKTIEQQFNLLRIVDNDNYPAFFVLNGIKYKLTIEKMR